MSKVNKTLKQSGLLIRLNTKECLHVRRLLNQSDAEYRLIAARPSSSCSSLKLGMSCVGGGLSSKTPVAIRAERSTRSGEVVGVRYVLPLEGVNEADASRAIRIMDRAFNERPLTSMRSPLLFLGMLSASPLQAPLASQSRAQTSGDLSEFRRARRDSNCSCFWDFALMACPREEEQLRVRTTVHNVKKYTRNFILLTIQLTALRITP
mmetsp:Transcript_68180/g.128792  ORF Transcript_68180/g.128792 Transcript_68180/m.128792 type:complete len:208 (+) Transcript_68180:1123-1746(+)